MEVVRLLGWHAALSAALASVGATGAELTASTWQPAGHSYWPEEEPKPRWWHALGNASLPVLEDVDAKEGALAPLGAWPAAAEVVRAMGKGINLGNTFDMVAHYPERQTFERNQRMIDLYAAKGFTHVRIPVTWGETFDPHSNLTSMVTRVVNYSLSKGLWVMINTHHEGWLKCCYDGSAPFNSKFAALWKGISTHFSDAGDRLVFEVLNEPEGAFGDWSRRSPPPTAYRGQQLTREICQVGLRAIREVSSKRVVFCMPNAQGNVHQAGAVFGSTSDFGGLYDRHVAISLHTYDPWDFCGESGQNTHFNEGSLRSYYDGMLQTVRRWQQSTGIAVHIGEFGIGRKHPAERDANIIRSYYRHLSRTMSSYGWTPTVWNDGGWYAIANDDFEWVYGLADAAMDVHVPGPAPAPGPEVHRCCWGGCTRCGHDAWCNKSPDHCRKCSGGWCAVPAVAAPQEARNGTAALAQVRRHHEEAPGTPPKRGGAKRRSLRAKLLESDASAMMQGKRERRKASHKVNDVAEFGHDAAEL